VYKTIHNNPQERENIFYPWTYWDNAFSEKELKIMCDYFSKNGVDRAAIYGEKNGQNSKSHVDETVRVSNIKMYNYDAKNENINWIFDRMNMIIDSLNNQFYNFNLNGYDYFQYGEYEGYENGRQEFHMDTIMGLNKPIDSSGTRKLSLTVLLNEPGVDFEGGDLCFNLAEEKHAVAVPNMKAGQVICFPSFLLHKVSPVTKGTRKSLVVWALGPKFI